MIASKAAWLAGHSHSRTGRELASLPDRLPELSQGSNLHVKLT